MADHLREEIAHLHAQVCGALADPSRILILYTLEEGPHSVGELVAELNLPQPTISRHLGILRDRGLVCAERDHRQVVYTLADSRVIEALDMLRAILNERLEIQYSVSRVAVTKTLT